MAQLKVMGPRRECPPLATINKGRSYHGYATLAGSYRYMEDLIRLEGCRLPEPMGLVQSLQASNSPLRWQEWDTGLSTHPDQRFRQYIVNGIREGFRVGFDYRCRHPVPGIRMQSRQSCGSVKHRGVSICTHQPLWGNTKEHPRKVETHRGHVLPGGW